MRSTSIIAAAIGGLFVASSSFASFVVSRTYTSVDATFDRVDVYALNDGVGTGTGLLAVEMAVDGAVGSNAIFRSTAAGAPNITNTADTPNRSFVRIDSEDASTTSLVSRSPAGNWPLRADLGASTVGIEDFSVVVAGLAGAAPAQVAPGALFARLFVTKAYQGLATGNVGGSAGAKVGFSIQLGGGVVNVVPTINSNSGANVNFGAIVTTPLPFSGTVVLADADAGDVLSLTLGALPANVSGVTVTPSGTNPRTFTIAGTIAYIGNGTTNIPFTTSDGQSASSPDPTGVFAIRVTPEPASLSLIGLGGMLMGRRRK